LSSFSPNLFERDTYSRKRLLLSETAIHTFTGATLGAVTVLSTDEHWKPAFIEGVPNFVYKLLDLDSMALYFETVCSKPSPSVGCLVLQRYLML
jgi:hypothetical protein